ncbi:MAG: hypothetical protein KJ970_04280 [Candidatus Eisenbacteria bacterium]|uniref:Uncharacterized protein n=1 Tax=Eiseniibacteriota bacterium TaxID=2212470 RepID=A0A948RVB0_UNCEI|nr:hypothetical protein [Candidatus Eisenbacteria bacterium]MBU2690122.1 hypothetical protein [Candidatus Eisenbacteria bacterium]
MKYIPFLLLCFSMAGIVLAQDEPLEYKPTAGTVILHGIVLDGQEFQLRIEDTKLFANDTIIWEVTLEERSGMDTTSITEHNFTKFLSDTYRRARNSGADPEAALQEFAHQYDFIDRIEKVSPGSYNIWYPDGEREILVIGEPGPDNSVPTIERVHAQYNFFVSGIIKTLNKGGVVVINPARRDYGRPITRTYSPQQVNNVLREVIRVLQGGKNFKLLDTQTIEEIKRTQ